MRSKALSVAVWLLAGSLALAGCSALSAKAGRFTSRPVSVFHLQVGQCLNPPTKVEAQVSSLDVLSCHAPHTQQVFALVKASGGNNFPGPQALEKLANAKCLQYFAGFVGVPYQQSNLFYTYLLPSVRSWAEGDRTVVCVITTTGLKLTSSSKGSKR